MLIRSNICLHNLGHRITLINRGLGTDRMTCKIMAASFNQVWGVGRKAVRRGGGEGHCTAMRGATLPAQTKAD